MFSSFVAIAAFAGTAAAHFRVLAPTWRGDSFAAGASQYTYPCANVNETTDINNRTLWPATGGSVVFNGSHPWAVTYVNLALGSNVTNFNISLVEGFNQTGPGVFCFKSTPRDRLDAGFKAAGYTGLNDSRIQGLQASVQIIQLGERGSALYNCADIRFNNTAQLLSDDQCKNGTGVSGVHIGNLAATSASASASASGSARPAASSGAASALTPVMGSGLFAAALAWGLL